MKDTGLLQTHHARGQVLATAVVRYSGAGRAAPCPGWFCSQLELRGPVPAPGSSVDPEPSGSCLGEGGHPSALHRLHLRELSVLIGEVRLMAPSHGIL